MLEEFRAKLMRVKGACIRSIELISEGRQVKIVYETDTGELITPPAYKLVTQLPEYIRMRKELLKENGSVETTKKISTDDDEETKLIAEINALIAGRTNDLQLQLTTLISILERRKQLQEDLRVEVQSAEQLLKGGECGDRGCNTRNRGDRNHLWIHTEAQRRIIDALKDLETRQTAANQEKDKIEKELAELKKQLKLLKGE